MSDAYLIRRSIVGCTLSLCVVLSMLAAAPPASKRRLPFEYLQVDSVRIQPVVDSPAVTLNLHSLQEQLGATEIGVKHYTDGEAESFHFVCYRGGGRSNSFVLVVDSDDEMGGPERDVMGITVARPAAAPTYAERCGTLRDSTWSPVTDRGIRLGMDRSAVEKLLGPRHGRGEKVSYEVYDERPKGPGDGCGPVSVSSELNLLYKNHRLVSLRGSRSDVC